MASCCNYNDNNPPTAVNATKNILDLIHVNAHNVNDAENERIIRKRLPFYDDSQIKFLSVRQNVNTTLANASILIEPFKNILNYANIYSELDQFNEEPDIF